MTMYYLSISIETITYQIRTTCVTQNITLPAQWPLVALPIMIIALAVMN